MTINAHKTSRWIDRRFLCLSVVATLVFGLCVTAVEFHEIPVSDAKSFFVLIGQWSVVTAAALPVFILLLANQIGRAHV